jgi:ribonuclease BN (tRNA processing enzyme)
MSETILELAEKADLLIFDSMFTPDQYWGRADKIVRREWGHSTWETAVEIAQRAKVKKLVLFHHGNADSVVEETQELAQRRFPETVAAYEGLEIEV